MLSKIKLSKLKLSKLTCTGYAGFGLITGPHLLNKAPAIQQLPANALALVTVTLLTSMGEKGQNAQDIVP